MALKKELHPFYLLILNIFFNALILNWFQKLPSTMPLVFFLLWNILATFLFFYWAHHKILPLHLSAAKKFFLYFLLSTPFFGIPITILLLIAKNKFFFDRWLTPALLLSCFLPFTLTFKKVPFGLSHLEYNLISHLPPLVAYTYLNIKQYQLASELTPTNLPLSFGGHYKIKNSRKKFLINTQAQSSTLSLDLMPLGQCWLRGSPAVALDALLRYFFLRS